MEIFTFLSQLYLSNNFIDIFNISIQIKLSVFILSCKSQFVHNVGARWSRGSRRVIEIAGWLPQVFKTIVIGSAAALVVLLALQMAWILGAMTTGFLSNKRFLSDCFFFDNSLHSWTKLCFTWCASHQKSLTSDTFCTLSNVHWMNERI